MYSNKLWCFRKASLLRSELRSSLWRCWASSLHCGRPLLLQRTEMQIGRVSLRKTGFPCGLLHGILVLHRVLYSSSSLPVASLLAKRRVSLWTLAPVGFAWFRSTMAIPWWCVRFRRGCELASLVSPYGGNYLNQLLSDNLKSKEIQVTAPCFIKKQTVEGVVANIQKIQFPNTRPSFVAYSQMVWNERDMRSRILFAIWKNAASVSPPNRSLKCTRWRRLLSRPPPSTPISYTLPDNMEVHLDQDSYYIPEVMMVGTDTVSGEKRLGCRKKRSHCRIRCSSVCRIAMSMWNWALFLTCRFARNSRITWFSLEAVRAWRDSRSDWIMSWESILIVWVREKGAIVEL